MQNNEFVSSHPPEGLLPSEENLLTHYHRIGALQFGDFQWKLHRENPEAPHSPIYFDIRRLRRFPQIKYDTARLYNEVTDALDFDLFADVPTAVSPIVATLSDMNDIGQITPRLDAKGYGSGATVDGLADEEKDAALTALLVDDVLTGGGSKKEAITVLEKAGVTVKDILVLIDYQLGGKEKLEAMGYNVHSVFTMQEVLEFYAHRMIISREEQGNIQQRLDALKEFLVK